LTELLVENENKVHNLEVEKESFEKHCIELKEERNMLREYIDKISEDFKDANEILSEENKNLSIKVKEYERSLSSKEDQFKKNSIECESLKKIHAECAERIKNMDRDLKLKIIENSELEKKLKDTEKDFSSIDDQKNELERENLEQNKKINELSRQINELQKENLDLIKKNKNLLISQENFQADLLSQNQILQNSENKLKEQLEINNEDLEQLKDERDNLKQLMNDAINKCSQLIREKLDMERELSKKTAQVENLKNTNMLLHKNFSQSIKSSREKEKEKQEEMNNDEKIIKIGESKLEETNMLNLIRREKEKNKEFLEEIKKLKQI
jgi:hypothetical protein